MRAYMSPGGGREADPVDIPAELADQAQSEREKLIEYVVETDEALMERYLEGEEIGGEELAAALRSAVAAGELFPVTCGVATQNLGTTAVLDLLVEGIPSPSDRAPADGDGAAAFVFKTVADPFAGRITVFRVLSGQVKADSTLVNSRTHGKERLGQLLLLQGKEHHHAPEFVAGDIGAVAKLKETMTGDVLLASDAPVEVAPIAFPQPVMSFAVTPKAKGDEDKVATALRRLAEEDPTLVLRRDEQTGEQLLAGMSQMHVEVAVRRLKGRFGVEVDLHQPRVPYLETIRKEARARHRYKKQTGGRGQFGDCSIVLEPREGPRGLRVRRQDRRRRDPSGLPAGRRQGRAGGDGARRARRCPGGGRDGPARRRAVPQRRLVGDGLQDRRLHGVQGRVRDGGPGAARADHGARRDRPGRVGRGRERRPQLEAGTAARHGAGRAA